MEPNMKSYELNIEEYQEFSNEEKDWTESFKKAVAALEEKGGGTLFIPSGNYPTHSIRLKSNMTLHLDAGATLFFLDDIENYERIDSEFEGVPVEMYMPCIYVDHAEHVSIIGQGTIDGNGKRWWREAKTLPYKRPYLICFQYCNHVKIESVYLINSPVWTVHPMYCNDVMIHGVSIKNPADSPNTDGINPNSSSNVRISNCLIDVGDDCIAIKAGTEATPAKRPCENITITNCNMIHGHGGIVIGSEMSGTVRNVSVSNCVFQDTDRGIRLKTRRKRGGAMEMLTFNNIIMDRVICPFIFNMYYYCGTSEKDRYVWDKDAYPVDEGTPGIRNIMISNVMVTNATAAAGFIYGLAEQYVENITFSNCRISMNPQGTPGMPAMMGHMEPMKSAGFFIRNAKGIIFDNVTFNNVTGEEIDKDDTVDLVER